MPRFIVPRQHGPHRIAAIALYRALITQTRASSIPPQSRDDLLTLIRHRARRNIHLQSRAKLHTLFISGWELLDRLDLCATETGRITSRSKSASEYEPISPVTDALGPSEHDAREAREWIADWLAEPRTSALLARLKSATLASSTTIADPGSKETTTKPASLISSAGQDHLPVSILTHPLPSSALQPHPPDALSVLFPPSPTGAITGPLPRRRVPKLASANRIPILRTRGHQPDRLSQYIIGRMARRIKDSARLDAGAEMVALGVAEDAWDAVLEGMWGTPAPGAGEGARGDEGKRGRGQDRGKTFTSGSGKGIGNIWRTLVPKKTRKHDGGAEGDLFGVKEGSWAEWAVVGRELARKGLTDEARSAKERAEVYVSIVDRETELKEQERKERVMQRNERAWERKRARYRRLGIEWEERSVTEL